MKVGILAGGAGTRLAEHTDRVPKPMVEIGGRPILWHIMKHYLQHGFRDFVIALGYRGDVIKKYMVDYVLLNSDFTVENRQGSISIDNTNADDWAVRLVDTGLATGTGGRIKQLIPYMDESTFLLTWGDGVSDINLTELVEFHRSHGKLATVTAVHPPSRFGIMDMEGDRVVRFMEKPQRHSEWINGAFFVLEPGVLDYIESKETMWEQEPMNRLAAEGQLMAYRHESFWQCMDTLHDQRYLESLWQRGEAPWKTWR